MGSLHDQGRKLRDSILSAGQRHGRAMYRVLRDLVEAPNPKGYACLAADNSRHPGYGRKRRLANSVTSSGRSRLAWY